MNSHKPIFLPPKGFKPSTAVQWAEFQPRQHMPEKKYLRGAQKRGLIYEAKVQKHFTAKYRGDIFYIASPWIRFVTADPRDPHGRWAQPDGFIVDLARSKIVIIEVKIRHMQSAWWGLRNLYEPLIRLIFGQKWSYSVCEVVNYFEPHIYWPERFELTKEPSSLRTNAFGVMILPDRDLRPTLESL